MGDGSFCRAGIRANLALVSSDSLTASLLEENTFREYRETSRAGGCRMMKSIRYRFGGSRVRPVEHNAGVQRVDPSQPGLSDPGDCLAGTRHTFRIRYDRMLSIEPNADSVGVCRRSPPLPLSLPGAPTGSPRTQTLFDGGQDGY